MDYLSKEELWQINQQYLQNMLCAQAPYALGANKASMGYDVDELDKIPSGVGVF